MNAAIPMVPLAAGALFAFAGCGGPSQPEAPDPVEIEQAVEEANRQGEAARGEADAE